MTAAMGAERRAALLCATGALCVGMLPWATSGRPPHDDLAILISNTLLLTSYGCWLVGVRLFRGLPSWRNPVGVFVLLSILVTSWLTLVQPWTELRILIGCLVMAAMRLATAHVLIRNTGIQRLAGIPFALILTMEAVGLIARGLSSWGVATAPLELYSSGNPLVWLYYLLTSI
ncbi:MAG: hypothetical protein KDI37_13545, partial [Xanthomonadales bacterium]|nr:hypothetical protein [Xanthomonadales bacterium]